MGDSNHSYLELQNGYMSRGCTYNIHIDMSKWTKTPFIETQGITAFNFYVKVGSIKCNMVQLTEVVDGHHFVLKNETTGELISEAEEKYRQNDGRIEFSVDKIKHTDKLCLSFKSGYNFGNLTFEVNNFKVPELEIKH